MTIQGVTIGLILKRKVYNNIVTPYCLFYYYYICKSTFGLVPNQWFYAFASWPRPWIFLPKTRNPFITFPELLQVRLGPWGRTVRPRPQGRTARPSPQRRTSGNCCSNFFYRMPFMLPNQQCQNIARVIIITDAAVIVMVVHIWLTSSSDSLLGLCSWIQLEIPSSQSPDWQIFPPICTLPPPHLGPF